jgi:methionyl-tRNA formyltransferase
LRTAYLGTSPFAVTALERLAASEHRPALVVTPPDRPRGRGRRLGPPPVAEAAARLGIPVHQTATVNDSHSVERLRDARPEAIAVCAFGQLIGDPLLGGYLMLNVHPSLVPRWRGAAPIERALMAGDERTGVTIMRVTAGLDSGPVALQEEVEIGPGEDYGRLAGRLADLGGELLVRALDLHGRGELEFVEQDEALATYAEKIAPEERRLDPARSATELERAVRALNPHIGTHLELEGGERLGVRAAATVADSPPSGELEVRGGTLVLGCTPGGLRLEEVQPSGRRPMAVADFLRGHRPPKRAL